jgi:hypothetical protein
MLSVGMLIWFGCALIVAGIVFVILSYVGAPRNEQYQPVHRAQRGNGRGYHPR